MIQPIIERYMERAREQGRQPETMRELLGEDGLKEVYSTLWKSIGDEYKDWGREEGSRETAQAILRRLLRKRFGQVPRKVAARIVATTKLSKLKTWIENILDAECLADVGIPLA